MSDFLRAVRHPVDLYKHLVEVPAPVFASAHSIHPLAPKFRGKHQTKPVPQVAHRLPADLDTTLVMQAFDIAQRQRKPNVAHHRLADDLWARLEIAERGARGQAVRLAGHPDCLKSGSSEYSLWPSSLKTEVKYTL